MDRRTCELFARILEYPGPDLLDCVSEVSEWVSDPVARDALGRFEAFVAGTDPGRVEEIYSETFDLNPARYPYAGHHLCGENYKRSMFMVALSDLYRESGFDGGVEMPDHLAVLLRFISQVDNEVLAEDLLAEAVLPTVENLAAGKAPPSEAQGGCGAPPMLGDLVKPEERPAEPAPSGPYDAVFAVLLSVLQNRARMPAVGGNDV